MNPSRRTAIVAAASAAVLGPKAAFGQGPYPDRPIRLVVPFAPGSGVDVVGRYVGNVLGAAWKVPVTVENKPGAGGAIAASHVAKSVSDGYTLLMTSSTHYVSPLLQSGAYDAVADFEPVAQVVNVPLLLVTAIDSPIKSVGDIVAMSKARPRSISYGSSGVGSPSHMCGALLSSVSGIDMVHVPYTNSSQILTDTSTGEVNITFAGPVAIPLVKAGKLRLLGVTSARRSEALADVPAVGEAEGAKGYEFTSPIWVFAPRGTAPAIVKKLTEAIEPVVSSPGFRAFCEQQLVDPVFRSAAELKALAADESAKWRRLVQLTKA